MTQKECNNAAAAYIGELNAVGFAEVPAAILPAVYEAARLAGMRIGCGGTFIGQGGTAAACVLFVA